MASSNSILRKAEKHYADAKLYKNRVLYGVYEGFPFLVDGTSSNYSASFLRIVICTMGETSLEARKQQFLDQRFQVFCHANSIELILPMRGTTKKCFETLLSGIENTVTQLCAGGYVGSDEMGIIGGTGLYRVKGRYHLLNEESARNIGVILQGDKAAFDAIREDYALGLVGAIIGGMLGCLVVLLVARLGYVTAISSVLVGAGIVYGYTNKRLGKKLSPVSAVLCGIIAVVFSYGTFRMDLAIDIHDAAPEIALPSAFIYGRAIMQSVEGGMGQYYENLFLMAGICILGAAAMIALILREQKLRFEIKRVS